MKKIGILTFHNADNYGAILQAIALRHTVCGFGHECRVIDYVNPLIKKAYKIGWHDLHYGIRTYPLKAIRLFPKRLILNVARRFRHRMFRREITKYNKPISIEAFRPDAVIFGSDQIWNSYITGKDTSYLGNIAGKDSFEKIAYAASMGWGDFTFLKSNEGLLRQFRRIGVRENSLAEDLMKLGLRAETNLDPTLLLTKEQWDALLHLDDSTQDSPYILLYAIRSKERTQSIANKLKEKYGLPVFTLCSKETFTNKEILNFSGGYSSIRDFVKKIRNASFVVTDSFHGTAFSVIYGKRFMSLRFGDNGDLRQISLLEQLGLTDNFITYDSDLLLFDKEYDYSLKLNDLRNKSIEFLKKALDNE